MRRTQSLFNWNYHHAHDAAPDDTGNIRIDNTCAMGGHIGITQTIHPGARGITGATSKWYIVHWGSEQRVEKLQLEHEVTKEEIKEDFYMRRLNITMTFSLRKAYAVVRDCSPLSYGFDVDHCADYWKLVAAGEQAGIIWTTKENGEQTNENVKCFDGWLRCGKTDSVMVRIYRGWCPHPPTSIFHQLEIDFIFGTAVVRLIFNALLWIFVMRFLGTRFKSHVVGHCI